MIKYILAATLCTIAFQQTTAKIVNKEEKAALKCIPRHKREVKQIQVTKNLVQQTPSSKKKQSQNAQLEQLKTKIQAQWLVFVGPSDKTVPPPPPAAWQRYQQANKLNSAAKIPISFFERWKLDFLNSVQKGADGKPLPFCDQ